MAQEDDSKSINQSIIESATVDFIVGALALTTKIARSEHIDTEQKEPSDESDRALGHKAPK
jgi:hypothetical protein